MDVATIDFENREVRLPQLRQLILEEIMTYAEPAKGGERPDVAGGKKRKLPEGEGGAAEPSGASSSGSESTAGAASRDASVDSTPLLEPAPAAAPPPGKRQAGPTPVEPSAPEAAANIAEDTPNVASYLADTPAAE